MPRARNIKPGFFENEHLGVLNSDARLLFAALWTLADKQGVVECRIAKIRTYAFRYRNEITDNDVYRELTVLTRLDNGDMLSKVTYNGNDYLLIHNFVKHASPHHTEKRGDYPDFAMLKSLINNDNEKITVNSPLLHGENPPESLILNPDSLNPDKEAIFPKSPPTPPKKIRGTRLSEDWELPEDWGDWAMSEFNWDIAKIVSIMEKFKDHWLAKAGSDGVKLNWQSTWKNWCRREYEGVFKK